MTEIKVIIIIIWQVSYNVVLSKGNKYSDVALYLTYRYENGIQLSKRNKGASQYTPPFNCELESYMWSS